MTSSHPRVRKEDVDRALHDRAFAAAGIGLDHLPWDEAADWAAYDLVVIRSPWDYAERTEEFLAWLAGVEAVATIQNPPALIRWNLDKRYLDAFAAGGVATVATRIATTIDDARAALAARGDREVVVKPVVSAGSRLTGRFAAGDAAAVALADAIVAEGGTVMVQPFVRSVAEEGEVSVVVFDGEVSHALRKGPILDVGGTFLGGSYEEHVDPVDPTPAQVAVAEAAAARARAIAEEQGWLAPGEALLYGRYDLVRLDDGTEALLEAELFEPSFFLGVDPGAPDRFAAAVRRRIDGA